MLAGLLAAVVVWGGARLVSRSEDVGAGGDADESSAASPSGPFPDRPGRRNLLLIKADDMRADELAWMPRTRRLIGDAGLRFENSFAPDPLCCPSRASLLAGQYSHNHGVVSHEEPYGFGAFDDSDTLATRLQENGYRTALIGKYLNGYGRQPTYGAGEDSMRYVPPGWTEWWASTDRVWGPEGEFLGGTYSYFHLASNVNGAIRTWPDEYTTDVTGRQARDLVRDFGETRGEDGRPWFVWWNPVAPHFGGPRESDDPEPTPRADGFLLGWPTPARPDRVKGFFDDRIVRGLGSPPGGLAASETDDKPRYLRRLTALTAAEERALTSLTRQRAESLRVLDGAVARTLQALRDSGQVRRTIVVFTSDNGYYLGEHLKRQGKINLHEPSIRVPLLVSGPGIPRGRRYDPATTIDLSRTLASWGGVELADPDGVDLTPTIKSGDHGWGRPVVLEGLQDNRAYIRAREGPGWDSALSTIGVRLGGWKYIRYATGESELYDLTSDPLERESIAGAAGGMRSRLEALYERYVRCAGKACRNSLPSDLAMGPDRNRATTHQQRQRARDFYG